MLANFKREETIMQSRNTLPVVPALLAALFACGAVMAQGTQPSTPSKAGATPSTVSPTTPSPPAPGSTGVDKGAGTGAASSKGAQADKSALPASDRRFVEKAAQGNLAEVAVGQMALTKASNDAVKQYGQMLVDDHGKANAALQQVAASKGMTLPSEPSAAQKREAAELQKKNGATFDHEFIEHMVSDHKKDVSEYRSEAKSAKDPDVKNYAATTLPTLEQHLQKAQQLSAQLNASKRQSPQAASAPAK
jgi:putative membrane protein